MLSWCDHSSHDRCGLRNIPRGAEEELDYGLGFPGGSLDSGDWQRTFTLEGTRIYAKWPSRTFGALAYIDYLVYACAFNKADLDTYFSKDNSEHVFFSG
jgi:hypothetical protein